MSIEIGHAYDSLAAQYSALALADLDRVSSDRVWLSKFAELAAVVDGTVMDLGCGPGHVTDHLTRLGVATVGCDISAGLVAVARRTFPLSQFRVADLTALGVDDGSLGGVVARYSLIHMLPSRLDDVFGGWCLCLRPGAPVLVSFFASPSAERHGTPFDHAVANAYELHPATIVRQLEDAGYTGTEVGLRPPLDGERALDHATILARRAEMGPVSRCTQ